MRSWGGRGNKEQLLMGMQFPLGVIKLFWNERWVIDVRLCKYTTPHWITCLKRVDYMICELYLNETSMSNKEVRLAPLLQEQWTGEQPGNRELSSLGQGDLMRVWWRRWQPHLLRPVEGLEAKPWDKNFSFIDQSYIEIHILSFIQVYRSFPFYKWGSWGSERLSDMLMQLVMAVAQAGPHNHKYVSSGMRKEGMVWDKNFNSCISRQWGKEGGGGKSPWRLNGWRKKNEILTICNREDVVK